MNGGEKTVAFYSSIASGGLARVALALPVAQGLHAALEVGRVVIKIVRAVVACWLAHVVEVVGLGRVERGLNRAEAGRGDGAGREPRVEPRVVGRLALKVALVNLPVVLPLPGELRRVDDGRVYAERHPLLQAVVDDGGDDRALLLELRLRLYERGDGQDLARREIEPARRARPFGLPLLAEAFDHRGDHRSRRR